MRRKKTTTTLIMWAVALLVVLSLVGYGGNLEPAAPPAPTMKTLEQVEPRIPITQSDIPLTITQSGSYYFTADLTAAATAITVEVNDVTIDLMGYQLIGPGSASGHGIYMDGRRNVEVRNGTVHSFPQSGIYEADSAGRNHRLINVRVFSNGMLGIFLQGEGHLVRDCTSADNASTGVRAASASTLTGNTVYQNEGYGISAGASIIIGNTVTGNDDAGIFAGDRCLVAGNTISGNNQSNAASQAGIKVSSSCLIRANAINYNNRNDIYVSGAGNCIERNLLTNSAGYGINFSGTPNFYANNRAHGHTKAYVITTPQTDGGGNWDF
ncbi:MAG: right-handed parallel beta-helix repeat-containing protein [Planctomycetota bacterium]